MKKTIYYFGAGHLDNLYSGVDGGSYSRIPFLNELVNRRCTVKWLGYEYKNRTESNLVKAFNLNPSSYTISVRDRVQDIGPTFTDSDLEDDGILFIELRPFISKEGYNFEKECETQITLIDYFISKGRKVFVQDREGWCTQIPDKYCSHINLLRAYHNKIDPRTYNSEHFFMWTWSDIFEDWRYTREIFDISYCGNVYERRDEFRDLLKPSHDAGKSIAVAGNWLRKKYDDRDFSLDNFPNNIWFGSTEHWTTLPLLAMSKCTVHCSNKRQREIGLISIRVFEARMAKVPVFVYDQIDHIDKYVTEDQIIKDGDELLWKLNNLDMRKVYYNFAEKIKDYELRDHVDKFESIIWGLK
jgi:hypothetical protein